MLTRDEGFEEWQLADAARNYIPLYLKRPGDKVCYIPYMDIPTRSEKYVKFGLVDGNWLYMDNSQHS